jgi:hypothetical protein
MTSAQNVLEPMAPVSNGAAEQLAFEQPYSVKIEIEGSAAFLFHRGNNESVEAKAKAAKGSKAKKSDDLESYVYRDEDGKLAIPGEYFRMAIVNAAKFKQDPRSPRKSAMDLFKAGIAVLDEHCSLGTKDWDYLDRRRVMIQRNGVTRERPAMRTGWRVVVTLQVLLPEYISSGLLNEVVQAAGRLVGVGDFRPTYGRYSVVRYDVLTG